ncbi:ABC transporter substrate-binding protein [Belliella pelovolcani]|uniref:Amino acid/amide ABC transporter substrate-binding protein, HAAT family n=1 Tax=Belliella pelovolcani TaxID=529505 RepID=A0A1N7PUZ1_9BACT|nr:ABC transporter substrate-binding protein [Belliella pelovolcani]SIT14411.1 amino acid/amide ABC transporter substrate-binding protein, HAAT family [Belliella pelovolcani]
MKSIFLLPLFLLSFFVQVQAQDPLNNYNRAKTLISYGNYKDAMDLLRPYMDEKQFGNLSNYATFYFAQAAFLNKQTALAKASLSPLIENARWEKIEDVRYLMALVHFEEESFSDGLGQILLITDEDLKKEAENATYNYLKNASLSYMVGNIAKYESNKGFLLALKEQLERQTVMSSNDRNIYNQIKDVRVEGQKDLTPQVKRDDVLDIAVVLPFNYNGGTDVRRLNSTNFIFELYQGINFAIEEARRKGLRFNVKSFDTQRNPDRTRSILADPFFDIADVIIGPLYPEEMDVVAAFSEKKGIPFINPLSNIDDKLETFDFAYLFRPSISSIANGVMDFARKNIEGKRIAIAYSTATRDEMLAKKIAEESSRFDYQIVAIEKVNERNIRDFFDRINLKRGNENPRTDMVIILSDDPNVASPTFGLLESISREIPVLVMDSWLYFNFANFEMLQSQNFHFIANNTMKFGSQELEDFREGFYAKYKVYPSLNAHLGYELMTWISGTINNSRGFDLRNNLNQMTQTQGKISYGLDFRNSKNNRFVPVLQLQKGVLEMK